MSLSELREELLDLLNKNVRRHNVKFGLLLRYPDDDLDTESENGKMALFVSKNGNDVFKTELHFNVPWYRPIANSENGPSVLVYRNGVCIEKYWLYYFIERVNLVAYVNEEGLFIPTSCGDIGPINQTLNPVNSLLTQNLGDYLH